MSDTEKNDGVDHPIDDAIDQRLTDYATRWRANTVTPPMPSDLDHSKQLGVRRQGVRRWTTPLAVAAAAVLIPTAAVLVVNNVDKSPGEITAGGGPSSGQQISQAPTGKVPPDTYIYQGKTLQLYETSRWSNPSLDAAGGKVVTITAGANGGKVDECSQLTVAYVTEQSADSVTIITADYGPPPAGNVACPDIGYPPYVLKVTLDAPLGSRALLDQDGVAHELLTLALPAYLPDGYVKSGSLEQTGPGNISQTFTDKDDPDSRLIVQQLVTKQVAQTYQKEVVATATVKGHPAEVWRSSGFADNLTIGWQVTARLSMRIQSVGSPNAPLEPEELIKIAQSIP